MRITTIIRARWQALAILPLATGAALVVHILTGVSLGLALLATIVLVLAMGVLAWSRLTPAIRQQVRRRAIAGAISGVLATIVYDLSRLLLIDVFHYTFWPFDIFSIFGQAIAGTNLAPILITAIGVIYHYTNGILFSIAYVVLLARRPWWTGILWALGLEAFMLALYPGWLHIQAYNEFVSLSMLGHIAYGIVLGITSKKILVWRE